MMVKWKVEIKRECLCGLDCPAKEVTIYCHTIQQVAKLAASMANKPCSNYVTRSLDMAWAGGKEKTEDELIEKVKKGEILEPE